MCDYRCSEKLEIIHSATISAKAEIKRMTEKYGPYWGKIEILNFMKGLTDDILPVGNYCSCDAMKRLTDAAGYLADINFSAATISGSEVAFQQFRKLRKILWGIELVPKQTTTN